MSASNARDRQRRARARRKSGRAVFRLELPELEVVEALILSGMPENEALRRRCVEKELGQVVAAWAARWLRHA